MVGLVKDNENVVDVVLDLVGINDTSNASQILGKMDKQRALSSVDEVRTLDLTAINRSTGRPVSADWLTRARAKLDPYWGSREEVPDSAHVRQTV